MSIPLEPYDASPLEIWGGVECTVNRVGSQYFDQLERSGHARRAGDLDLFAGLGIKAVRYPVLWERIAPEGLKRADWSWADERLNRLRELGLRPIVGLLHHGSGPRDTSLVDPDFPEKLAEFAHAVASRYPWVEDYTPVNEPLTTARFSGLYGYWYPHGRDDLTFTRALLAQCRAIVLSMRATREVNSSARLVQTEDLGKTFSTHTLSYQAEFENERRWLTFDLLCSRVGREHPMWGYMRCAGISEPELEWQLANVCPPDIVGINHYLTSERYLDEYVERYPSCSHGGNGRHRYADVEAVRVSAEGPAGRSLCSRRLGSVIACQSPSPKLTSAARAKNSYAGSRRCGTARVRRGCKERTCAPSPLGYCTTTIWQTVWLEPIPSIRIEELRITPHAHKNAFELEVYLHAPSSAWRLEATALEGGRVVARVEDRTPVATARLYLNIPYAKLWSPEAPNLYDLEVRLFDGDELLDEVRSYAGLRSLEMRAGHVCINGEPVYLKMVLDQGYWPDGLLAAPSDEALQTDIGWAKAFGFNGARKHQKIEDPRWLSWCDRLGLLV